MYGPGADREDVALDPSAGGVDLGIDVATAASNSRLLVVAGPGVNVGRVGRFANGGIEPKSPAPTSVIEMSSI